MTTATRLFATAAAAAACAAACATADEAKVKLLTLDPGHFHAALVQAASYPQVDDTVHVYAPAGPDLEQHLKRIESYNTRAENPTHWKTITYTGADYLEQMLAGHKGNLVIISGNNSRKADYILRSVQAGYNVLSDKPMVIVPGDLDKIKLAFTEAEKRGLLLDDMMTERHEITTILQRELAMMPAVFGTLEKGTADQPAITKESVHHYFKYVSGKPLQRPPWFFDTSQQGEGIVDVTTHLVDLVQWEAFPGQTLRPEDVKMLSARRWATNLTPAQFEKATGLKQFPASLQACVTPRGELGVYGNGEFTYTLRGVHAKVSVTWNFQAPEGAGDTHYSIMRGSAADLIIRQSKEQDYQPTLYVEKKSDASDEEFAKALEAGLASLKDKWPGLALKPAAGGWQVVIPAAYKVGHEAHFAQVTNQYLKYLTAGGMPAWEVPNILTKCHTIMEAYQMSR